MNPNHEVDQSGLGGASMQAPVEYGQAPVLAEVPGLPEVAPQSGRLSPEFLQAPAGLAAIAPTPQSATPNPAFVAPSASAPHSAAASLSAASLPLSNDDSDLVEKQAVAKAKQIIAINRHDPHAQSDEINRFRIDYMKKRYNKDVKLDDET